MDEPVVHQMKDTSHAGKTTKCGLEGKKLRTTGWASEVTCPQCLHPSAQAKP